MRFRPPFVSRCLIAGSGRDLDDAEAIFEIILVNLTDSNQLFDNAVERSMSHIVSLVPRRALDRGTEVVNSRHPKQWVWGSDEQSAVW